MSGNAHGSRSDTEMALDRRPVKSWHEAKKRVLEDSRSRLYKIRTLRSKTTANEAKGQTITRDKLVISVTTGQVSLIF